MFYKLNKKLYKINDATKTIKNPSFFIILSGLNKKFEIFSIKNQKTEKFKQYKINNKIIIKNLKKNSMMKTINSSMFLGLLDQNTILTKTMLINSFYFLFLHILALKFNNKIYTLYVLKKLCSLNYFQTKQLITQFCMLSTKIKFKNRNNMI